MFPSPSYPIENIIEVRATSKVSIPLEAGKCPLFEYVKMKIQIASSYSRKSSKNVKKWSKMAFNPHEF